MKNTVYAGTDENKTKRRWRRVISVLSAIMVFCTTYALIIPAITWERTLLCELEEHTHGDSCYKTVLIPEGDVLTCDMEEHVHGSGCYAEEKVLICGLENDESHTHTDECYETVQTLVCETAEHEHSELCYTHAPEHTEKVLVCTKTEHIHTDACFDAPLTAESKFVCGLEEHTHNKDCYFSDGTLRCTITEHQHSLECLSKTLNAPLDLTAEELADLTNLLTASTPTSGTYYERVDHIDSTTANYLIVSAEGNYALIAGTDGSTSVTGTALKLVPVKGNPGYFTISNVTSSMYWCFGKTLTKSGGTTTIRRGTNGVYLYQTRAGRSGSYTYPLFDGDSGNEQLTYNSASGTWTIRGTASNATNRYISVSDDSKFTSVTDTTYQRNMLILKQVSTTLDIPDDVSAGGGGQEEGEEKERPTYKPDASSISSSKQGNLSSVTSLIPDAPDTISGSYYSDPSTSKIEDKFFGTVTDGKSPTVNDGKVLTDKSVIYKGDDYNAFSSYDDGIFSVTFSALGQDYQFKQEDQVKIPVDVVFVLDVSGSMGNSAGNVTRRQAVVQAVNDAMSQIMTNSENRAGVVLYSSGGSTLLELDHYEPGTNGQFLNHNNSKIRTAANLKGKKSGTITQTYGETGGFTQGNGTYTQYGIALAAKMLEENEDTTYTATLREGTDYERTVTVQRQPVIILLSDGDPTLCSSNYTDVLSGPAYGSGVYPSTSNNKGIHGYYTILSANYYKRMAGIHYNNPAMFYTIGMGINTTGYTDLSGASSTGDCYKRAVLNPTSKAIGDLTNDEAKSTNPNKTYTAANTWSISCEMLSKLLDNSYGSSYVKVDSTDKYTTAIGTTNRDVPVLDNPYRNDYDYADGAYFGNLDTEALGTIFEQIISSSMNVKSYGYMLYKGTSVRFTDTIGEGMEIKGTPVLRYNGKNYSLTLKSSVDGVDTYVCNATAVTSDGSGSNGGQRSADLKQILIKVTTVDGIQTVSMDVPETILPSYTPDSTAGWYYEQFPVRLIYQVGLTSEAQEEVAAMAPGQTLTYYTNSWQTNAADTVQFPHPDNPYYNDVTYEDGTSRTHQYSDYTLDKTENTTDTEDYSAQAVYLNNYGGDPDEVSIHVGLGNNGKLVFQNEGQGTVSVNLHKTDMAGHLIADNPAKFELYTDQALTQKFGTYETKADGTLFIDELLPDTVYYLKEIEAPKGYHPLPEVKSFKVSADGTILGIDVGDAYLSVEEGNLIVKNPTGYELPATGGVGIYPLSALGILLIAGSLMYIKISRRKSEGRGDT